MVEYRGIGNRTTTTHNKTFLRIPLYNNRPSYSSFAQPYRDTFEDSMQKQNFDYSGYHANGAKT